MYSKLKETIKETIRKNGNSEISGPVLQAVLISMVAGLGEGAQFMGVATPKTRPDVHDGGAFYLATGTDIFPNFSGFRPTENGLHVLKWDGTVWVGSTVYSLKTGNGLKGDGTDLNKLDVNLEELSKTYAHKIELEEAVVSIETQLEKTGLENLTLNQKIDNLASNIIGLGGDIKGSVKGANVIELPNVAINGVAPGYTINGLTIQNLIENGDFSSGLTGWSSGTSIKLSVRDDILICLVNNTLNNRAQVLTELKLSPIEAGRLYVCYTVKPKYDTTTHFRSGIASSASYSITGGKWNRITGYITTKGDTGFNINIMLNNHRVGDEFYISNVCVIDMASVFGKGNEPTKEWCDEHIKGYIDGVQSVQTPLRISGETSSCINSEVSLRSLPKIKDYIKNDKLYKNIKRHYFTKEDNWTLRDDYEGDNFRYFMTLPLEYKASGSGVEGELFCNNYTPTSNVASVLTERDSNTIALYKENSSTIYLTLDKKVDNVNSIIPEGTFIDVITPKTEQVKLDTSGVVTTKPNGTIIFDYVRNRTDIYNKGVKVLDLKELIGIQKYVGAVLVELDTSKAKYESNTLTHPELKDGDILFYEYRYTDLELYGENEIEYFNKNNVLQSENGKLWQKVETATNDGQLTTKLEEII